MAPLWIIGRVYNILNKNSESAIGAIMLMVRTLPSFGDPSNQLLYLSYNHQERTMFNEQYRTDPPSIAYKKGKQAIYLDSKDYESSIIPFGRIYVEKIQLAIFSDIMVELIQLIGRGRRSSANQIRGAPIRLFFIDHAWLSNPSWKYLSAKFLSNWIKRSDWNLLYCLYRAIIESLRDYVGLDNLKEETINKKLIELKKEKIKEDNINEY